MTADATAVVSRRSRRSQKERSEATQDRLMQAALECLNEYGYSGTTMSRICDRAGLSRGAQVHHYPSKSELLGAAVRHLSDAMIEAFEREVTAAPTGERRIDAFLEGIWRTQEGPLFACSLELAVAARAEPELREVLERHFGELNRMIDDHVNATAIAVRPDDPFELREVLHLSVHLVQGFALDAVMHDRRARNRRLYERWCRQVRAVASAPPPAETT